MPRIAHDIAQMLDARRIEPNRPAREQASIGDSFSRLVDATERVVSDRIELTRLEV